MNNYSLRQQIKLTSKVRKQLPAHHTSNVGWYHHGGTLIIISVAFLIDLSNRVTPTPIAVLTSDYGQWKVKLDTVARSLLLKPFNSSAVSHQHNLKLWHTPHGGKP